MGERHPPQSGEFELDERWQYLLDLHRDRKDKSYTLLFSSPREGDDRVSYRMMHSHVVPERYVFLETARGEDGQFTDQYQYGLFVVDDHQRKGKLAIITRLGEGATIKNTVEWTKTQEQMGMDIPTPDQAEAFRLIFEDLAANQPLRAY